MTRWSVRLFCVVFCVFAFPYRSPAPLVFRPGEGWSYEKPGETGAWVRTRAKDQLEVAQQAVRREECFSRQQGRQAHR
jgi:hypothetical protein